MAMEPDGELDEERRREEEKKERKEEKQPVRFCRFRCRSAQTGKPEVGWKDRGLLGSTTALLVFVYDHAGLLGRIAVSSFCAGHPAWHRGMCAAGLGWTTSAHHCSPPHVIRSLGKDEHE